MYLHIFLFLNVALYFLSEDISIITAIEVFLFVVVGTEFTSVASKEGNLV